MYEKKNLKLQLSFIAEGDIRSAEIELRPLKIQEMLSFGLQHPVVFNYLLGQPVTLVFKDAEGKDDYSEVNAMLDLMWSTVVSLKIEGEEIKADWRELPDMLVAQVLSHFRTFNFISQGDVDFFAKIQQLFEISQGMPSSADTSHPKPP